jgi:hypothetical protein
MNEADGEAAAEIERLRSLLEAAERSLREREEAHAGRLMRAELKAEAVRAGMVDLDGLRLLDVSSLSVDESGAVRGAETVMERARRDKPWLFAAASSSSTASAPPSAPVRARHATEMSLEEWRAARAELLRCR